jgi:hypothetical protein
MKPVEGLDSLLWCFSSDLSRKALECSTCLSWGGWQNKELLATVLQGQSWVGYFEEQKVVLEKERDGWK